MGIRRSTLASALILSLTNLGTAAAQAPPPAPEPNVRDTLAFLTDTFAAGPAGAAIGLATAIEVANSPFGTSAGGFVFKLDPATGLRVRSAPTFGPSFAERALTVGEGKVSVGASLAVATYDKLNEFNLKEMLLARSNGPLVENRESGYLSLVLSSETLVVSTAVGATDKLDISVSVPFVKVKMSGVAWVQNTDTGFVSARVPAAIESSGLGDLAVGAKYRLAQFGEGPPDPGGIAVQLVTRLPTGSRENFRGLGITRVLGSLIVSAGKGKFRPHGNVGFEWWEKGREVPTDFTNTARLGARHQVQYVVGIELEASPKVTLLVDILGRHLLGDGSIAVRDVAIPPGVTGITALELAVATEQGIREWSLVPGLKWNVKGSFVISGNALISLADNGLRDFFTPVFGLDWTF